VARPHETGRYLQEKKSAKAREKEEKRREILLARFGRQKKRKRESVNWGGCGCIIYLKNHGKGRERINEKKNGIKPPAESGIL